MDKVETLIRELKNPNWEIRAEAARKLGDLRSRRAVPALIEIARNESVYFARNEAMRALGKIKDGRAVPALIEALNAPEVTGVPANSNEHFERSWTQIAAVETLGGFKDMRAVPDMLERLGCVYLQSRVVESLGKISGRVDAQQRKEIVGKLIEFTRSDWFMGEMRKNSPFYELSANAFANMLSKMRASEERDIMLEPKIRAPAGAKGKPRVKRAIAIC